MPTIDPLQLDVPEALATSRLRLRMPRAEEAPLVNAAVIESIQQIAAWMPWANPTPTPQQTLAWVRQAQAKFITREELHFLIFDLEGNFAGACGFHDIKWTVPKFEIGYWLRSNLSGRGYMTEAVRALTDLAFDHLDAARVEVRMDDRNERSWRVAERAGFTLEGILRRDARDVEGRLRDTRVYAKVRPE